MAKKERKFGRLDFITFGAAALVLMFLTYLLVAHTPLRQTIPGYPDRETQKAAAENFRKIDSLENVINIWAFQVANIQRVATGREPLPLDSMMFTRIEEEADEEKLGAFESCDSLLRVRMESIEEEQRNRADTQGRIAALQGVKFTAPLKGTLKAPFSRTGSHPFVELSAPAGTGICAILDGRIVLAEWSELEGCTIKIQHDNDLTSIVRFAAKLSHNVGEQVKAGTVIGTVGQTSELSDGSIQFELRYRNQTVDPAAYITF